MEVLQKLHRSQDERPGWFHIRCQRHLDDRTSSTAILCYRKTRPAAIHTRFVSHPRSHSYCTELVRPSCRRTGYTLPNKGISRCCAKVRICTRQIRSHCYRARDANSHSQNKVRHAHCEKLSQAMERNRIDCKKLEALARETSPCLLGWFAAATHGRSNECRAHVQNATAPLDLSAID